MEKLVKLTKNPKTTFRKNGKTHRSRNQPGYLLKNLNKKEHHNGFDEENPLYNIHNPEVRKLILEDPEIYMIDDYTEDEVEEETHPYKMRDKILKVYNNPLWYKRALHSKYHGNKTSGVIGRYNNTMKEFKRTPTIEAIKKRKNNWEQLRAKAAQNAANRNADLNSTIKAIELKYKNHWPTMKFKIWQARRNHNANGGGRNKTYKKK